MARWVLPDSVDFSRSVGTGRGFLSASLDPVFGRLGGHRCDRTFPLPAPRYPTGETQRPNSKISQFCYTPVVPTASVPILNQDQETESLHAATSQMGESQERSQRY